MITPYLMDYSASTINHAWLDRRRTECCHFDWMGEVWAEYVKIDGRWYVCNLANSRRTNLGPSVQIRKPEGLDIVHIAFDNLGIRRIILESFGNPTVDGYIADPEPGVWWYSLRVSLLLEVTSHSDVSRAFPRSNESSPLELKRKYDLGRKVQDGLRWGKLWGFLPDLLSNAQY